MFLQCSALRPLLSDHLLAPPSPVRFHTNKRLDVTDPPLRFGEFGFEVMQRPYKPSSYGTLISGFVLEAPLCLSRVSQLLKVECLTIVQDL